MPLELCVYAFVMAINLTVGGRLLIRGLQRRAGPECLLGASLSLDGLEWFFWVLAYYTPAEGTAVGDVLGAACRAGIVAHCIFLLAFTRTVFHPESRAAAAAVVGLALVMIASWLVGISFGDWLGYRSDRPWIWLEVGTEQVVYAWIFVAAAGHYSRMRKRLAHGLTDPVVANRVLLWGTYGISSLCSGLFYLLSIGVASFSGHYPFVLDVMMIVFTGVACSAIWLAFYPPAAYRSWVIAGGRAPVS
ncbi:MAG: hypothetical protein OEM49_06815 [Myxococcales bacterium]|nr:hypothetical protein [Myxococcales bacterium]MDH5306515.1 hypothetical protein [Myxococcales bacterium]MDH5566902.1 hypothetical protein [Myxococcales bacterium]